MAGERVKAYKAMVEGFDTHILAAESAGKARYEVFSTLHELGYGYTFADIRVLRSYEHDHLIPEYLENRREHQSFWNWMVNNEKNI